MIFGKECEHDNFCILDNFLEIELSIHGKNISPKKFILFHSKIILSRRTEEKPKLLF